MCGWTCLTGNLSGLVGTVVQDELRRAMLLPRYRVLVCVAVSDALLLQELTACEKTNVGTRMCEHHRSKRRVDMMAALNHSACVEETRCAKTHQPPKHWTSLY